MTCWAEKLKVSTRELLTPACIYACAVFSSGVGSEVTLAVLAITLTPIVLEARKTLGNGKDDEFRALPFL